MTISGCMIVRDNEDTIARAMECFCQIVDEIIIVDIGSADRTREIACRFTDKVYDFNCRNDILAARNFAFSKSSMDYVYMADADEILDELNRKKFLDLKKALPRNIDIVRMKCSEQLFPGMLCAGSMEYMPKMFKRPGSIGQALPALDTTDAGMQVFDSDIVVAHVSKKKDAKRDFSAFLQIAKPGSALSPRLHRLYAQELFIAGSEEDFLSAYAYFEWSLHQENFGTEEIQESQCVVARCCNLQHDCKGLFKVSLKNVIGKPSSEVCCELGNYFLEENDPEEAAVWYYTAAFGAKSELDMHYKGDIPLKKLSRCFERLGMKEEALKYKKMSEDWTFRRKKF